MCQVRLKFYDEIFHLDVAYLARWPKAASNNVIKKALGFKFRSNLDSWLLKAAKSGRKDSNAKAKYVGLDAVSIVMEWVTEVAVADSCNDSVQNFRRVEAHHAPKNFFMAVSEDLDISKGVSKVSELTANDITGMQVKMVDPLLVANWQGGGDLVHYLTKIKVELLAVNSSVKYFIFKGTLAREVLHKSQFVIG